MYLHTHLTEQNKWKCVFNTSVKSHSPSNLWTFPRVCGHCSAWEGAIWTLICAPHTHSNTHNDNNYAEQHQCATSVHPRLWPRHGWYYPIPLRGSLKFHHDFNRLSPLKHYNFTTDLVTGSGAQLPHQKGRAQPEQPGSTLRLECKGGEWVGEEVVT